MVNMICVQHAFSNHPTCVRVAPHDRTAWELLKPGGIMINVFSTKGAAYAKKFEKATTKMWQDYNDDQHMWVSGAFFQFSAGDGWEDLKGFDISPESAKDALDDSPMRFLNGGKENNIYAVQATKAYQDDSIDPDDPEKSFSSMMWMLPTLEVRDKALLAPRLSRAYQAARNDEERKALENNVKCLPTIYESLIKMDTFEFGFNLQSQLAADLIIDPSFNANEEQIVALKQGAIVVHTYWCCVCTVTAHSNPFLFESCRSWSAYAIGGILDARRSKHGSHEC